MTRTQLSLILSAAAFAVAVLPSCATERAIERTAAAGAGEENAGERALRDRLTASHDASYRAWFDAASPAEREEERQLVQERGVQTSLAFKTTSRGTLRSISGHRMRLAVTGAQPGDDAETVTRKFLAEIAPALGVADAAALRLRSVRAAREGFVLRFEQEHAGLPVWDSAVTVLLDRDLHVTYYFGALTPDDAFVEEGASARAQANGWYVAEAGGPARLAMRAMQEGRDERAPAIETTTSVTSGEVLAVVNRVPHAVEHKEVFQTPAGLQYDDQCHASGVATCPAGWCSGGVCQNPAASWPGTSKNVKTRSDQLYDYWKNEFGWWGWDGVGMKMSVFADDLDQCDANAYGNYMNFGSGYACLDVMGHEFTHNVLEQVAGFELGAIAEALGDIMGIYANRKINGSSSWTTANGTGCGSCAAPAGRHSRLDDPEAYVWEGVAQPSNWSNYRQGDYTPGTILSHAAFLMGRPAADGAHTTWGIPVTGIGLDLASESWFEAITACASSGMDFNDVRDCVTSKACGLGACSAPYDAFDAVGLWRNQTDFSFNVMDVVATARRPIPGATEEHMFYRPLSGTTLKWRMRIDQAFSFWSGEADTGLESVNAPTAAVVDLGRGGRRVLFCARQIGDAIGCKYIASDGIIHDAGTNLGTTTERPELVRTASGEVLLAWKTAGAGDQAIRYRRYNGSWAQTTVSPAVSAYGPALAAGYADQFSNAANGVWLVYRRSDGRIAYRREEAAGFGAEQLVGQADQAPTALKAPTAAMFRGRLHIAAMPTLDNGFTGSPWMASCAQPCDSASTWTRWVKQLWTSANQLHFDSSKDLRLYTTPFFGGPPGLRLKRSE